MLYNFQIFGKVPDIRTSLLLISNLTPEVWSEDIIYHLNLKKAL